MYTKKEAVLLAQEQPQAQTKIPANNVHHFGAVVNAPNRLQELRLIKKVRAKEMVSTVRRYYPHYDKHLQNKCEHSSLYGIRLCDDAMEALIRRYAPEDLATEKKLENRTLLFRVSCRMTPQEYDQLMDCVSRDGFHTTQNCLLTLIRQYLNAKGDRQA